MSTWHQKELGRWSEASAVVDKLLETFPILFAGYGAPLFMAVFTNERHEEGSHFTQHTLYFTPEAAPLAKTYGATPCQCPPSEGIALLAGDAHAWKKYFPNRLLGSGSDL